MSLLAQSAAELVMTEAEVSADKAGWLAARQEGITASEMPVLLGIAPENWGSPFSLYTDKVMGSEPFDSPRLRLGRHLEPLVADMWQESHPDYLLTPGGLYRHKDRPWQMATFDRLAWEAAGTPSGPLVGPVQIKTSAEKHAYALPNVIPVHYRVQCLWELDVLGTDQVIVPVMFLPGGDIETYVIDRDDQAEADMAWMRQQAQEFRERLAERRPPPVDWRDATTRALKRLAPELTDESAVVPVSLARRWRMAKRAEKLAERRVKLAANQIRERMGTAARAHVVNPDGSYSTVLTRSIGERKGYTVAANPRVESLRPGKYRAPAELRDAGQGQEEAS